MSGRQPVNEAPCGQGGVGGGRARDPLIDRELILGCCCGSGGIWRPHDCPFHGATLPGTVQQHGAATALCVSLLLCSSRAGLALLAKA